MAEIYIKFVPQQPVWVMYENLPVEGVVNSVRILLENYSSHPKIEYSIAFQNRNVAKYKEENIFASKEELKESIFG